MIRTRAPDKIKAKSLLEAAELEMRFLINLNPTKEAGQTIIGRLYENFRRLGETLMLIRGKESVGQGQHNDNINELLLLKIKTDRPINVLESLKKTRMDINYDGYIPTIDEINDSISIAKTCFNPILEEIKKELSKL